MIANGVAKCKCVEHILPVSTGKYKRSPVEQLPAHERLVIGIPRERLNTGKEEREREIEYRKGRERDWIQERERERLDTGKGEREIGYMKGRDREIEYRKGRERDWIQERKRQRD